MHTGVFCTKLRMLGHTACLLAVAATMGTMAGTGSACLAGSLNGTNTWCGFILIWPVAFIIAIPFALVFGLPLNVIFERSGWRRAWQYALAGLLIAFPVWMGFSRPLDGAYASQIAPYELLIYFGSGVAGALIFLLLKRRRSRK